jgi:hypothetical protein
MSNDISRKSGFQLQLWQNGCQAASELQKAMVDLNASGNFQPFST